MRRKPIIGIIAKPDYNRSERKQTIIVEDWRRAIQKQGGMAIAILPPNSSHDVDKRYNMEDVSNNKVPGLTASEKADLYTALKLCDGIVLEGGKSCHRYEADAAKWAIDHNLPVIGTCSGMNNIIIAMGGEVRQGTASERKRHEHPHEEKHVHSITVAKGSLLDRLIKADRPKVNSRHWMMTEPGMVKGMSAVAFSDDGLVEAVEMPDKKFVMGFKWHPESMAAYDEDQERIIKAFIEAAKNNTAFFKKLPRD